MEPNEETRFKSNFQVLFKIIKDLAQTDEEINKKIPPLLLKVIETTIDSYDNNLFIQSFIKNSYKYWHKILEKDEDFFINNSQVIFANLPSDKVKVVSELFKKENPKLNKKIRENLWRIMESFVKISIKYIHRKRSPCKVKYNENIKEIYQSEFFEEIDIKKEAEKWKIELVFPEYF